MDKSGQLTFSDDPLLNSSNQAYQLIEEGSFKQAVKIFDELVSIDPDYPGVVDGYRTAKFWFNRIRELSRVAEGRAKADFLMRQWEVFDQYASSKDMESSSAYRAAMRYVFFRASENYKIAFQKQEDTTDDFDLLLNLGRCFLRLDEYRYAIDTLEYAKGSYSGNAALFYILGEAYFHVDDIPRSLLYFRQAFSLDPSAVDLSLVKAKPVLDIVEIIRKEYPNVKDIREWIPVYGFLADIFYVRGKLTKRQVDSIQKEIYNLEINYQNMNKDQIEDSNVKPRLINKYLLMLDYYEFQNYSFENLSQIKDRLILIEKELFYEYFRKSDKR